MKIKELHKDIERYLLHDCYCPHEIYSFDGFFYDLFYEDSECVKLGETPDKANIICLAHAGKDEKGSLQILSFNIDLEEDKVLDCIRMDATENNLAIIKDIIENGINGRKFKFDEYNPGSTAKSLQEILELSNGVFMTTGEK